MRWLVVAAALVAGAAIGLLSLRRPGASRASATPAVAAPAAAAAPMPEAAWESAAVAPAGPVAAAPVPALAAAACPLDGVSPALASRGLFSSQWHTGAEGYEQAAREQRGAGAPLLVYFFTDWCRYCRALEDGLLSAGAVESYLGQRLVRVRVNPEAGGAERALARQYGVTGYPSLFLVDAAGRSEKVSPYEERTGENWELMSPDDFAGSLEERVGRWVEQLVYDASQLRGRGDAAGAVALLEKALALDPDAAAAYLERGVARTMAGDHETALADLRRARDLLPARLSVYEAIEFALGEQRRWAEAAACWSAFIDREPGAGRAFFRRGGSYYRAGDIPRALADTEKACTLGETRACEMARKLKG